MQRTGFADLPLHGGQAPRWLFGRMVELSAVLGEILIDEHGTAGTLRRLADPGFFQALSCVLGFDWHSSGTTTVACGALKEGFRMAGLEIDVAGGKGRASRRTLEEIASTSLPLSSQRRGELQRASRLTAKVDSAAVQDGHELYHHVTFFDAHGSWTVVQQGMEPEHGYARRYHWSSEGLTSFVETPHSGIAGRPVPSVLDLTSRDHRPVREASVALIEEGPARLERLVRPAMLGGQRSLAEWGIEEGPPVPLLRLPRAIDWDALRTAYECSPSGYEELLLVPGVGAATVRALALMSELLYGTRLSWRDPVRFSFAVGGKDGVPFPVDCRAMDEATEVLRAAIEQAKLGRRERLAALRRLHSAVPADSAAG